MVERVIDMSFLILAWQDETPEHSYYLDRHTGAIEMVSHDLIDVDELTDEIERTEDRYLYIPKALPGELKGDLGDFVNEIDNLALKRLLLVTLEAPNALAALRFVLKDHPKWNLSWDEFRQKRNEERVKKWLAANFLVEGDSQYFGPDD